MGLDQLFDDVEAEADAAGGAVVVLRGALERLEEAVQLGGRDRGAGVVDVQADGGRVGAGEQLDGGVGGAVLEGVGEEVLDDLDDAVGVPVAVGVALLAQLDAAVGEGELGLVLDAADEGVEVGGAGVDRDAAAEPGLGEVEEVADQSGGAVDGLQDPLDVGAGALAQVLAAGHDGRGELDDGERVSQVVADDADELLLELGLALALAGEQMVGLVEAALLADVLEEGDVAVDDVGGVAVGDEGDAHVAGAAEAIGDLVLLEAEALAGEAAADIWLQDGVGGLTDDLEQGAAEQLFAREAEPVLIGAVDEGVALVRGDEGDEDGEGIGDELEPGLAGGQRLALGVASAAGGRVGDRVGGELAEGAELGGGEREVLGVDEVEDVAAQLGVGAEELIGIEVAGRGHIDRARVGAQGGDEGLQSGAQVLVQGSDVIGRAGDEGVVSVFQQRRQTAHPGVSTASADGATGRPCARRVVRCALCAAQRLRGEQATPTADGGSRLGGEAGDLEAALQGHEHGRFDGDDGAASVVLCGVEAQAGGGGEVGAGELAAAEDAGTQVAAGEVGVAQVAVEEVGLADLAAQKRGLAQAEADEGGEVEDAVGEAEARELAELGPVDAHQLAVGEVEVVGAQGPGLHAGEVAALEAAVLEAAVRPAGLLQLAAAEGAAGEFAAGELVGLEVEAGEDEVVAAVGVEEVGAGGFAGGGFGGRWAARHRAGEFIRGGRRARRRRTGWRSGSPGSPCRWG